jgi:UDP-N-acetylglucosamine--N-acetylmuramyl-(pentapeptide) pyrophosphoryl-undecaprenol N-acetylglucosamine transferase
MSDHMIRASKCALIMAGGTGGHVFPGLAVAKELMARGWRVVWLGNPNGMEARLVPAHGIVVEPVVFSGLRGKGLLTTLSLPVNLLRACWQARAVLARVKPHVVLGLGGYITFPGGLMAKLTGRPLVLHEQNSIAGLANRVLAKVASTVLVAFPGALPGAKWVGNPVRSELALMPSPELRYAQRKEGLHILVVGGSLGAQVLNQIVPQALARMAVEGAALSGLTVRHQTGKQQQTVVQQAYLTMGQSAQVSEFIEDMADAYAQADVVICRAGAMTVSELAAVGVASVLVPYPHAVDDHQTTNARFLSDAGAGWLMPQAELTPESLASFLATLDRDSCLKAAVKARALAKADATQAVANVCEEMAHEA